MNTMTTIAIAVGAGIALCIPLLASFIFCVPGWFNYVVAPKFDFIASYVDDTGLSDSAIVGWASKWLMRFMRLVVLPLAVVILLCVTYFLACGSLIHSTCPYAAGWNTAHDELTGWALPTFRKLPRWVWSGAGTRVDLS